MYGVIKAFKLIKGFEIGKVKKERWDVEGVYGGKLDIWRFVAFQKRSSLLMGTITNNQRQSAANTDKKR